MSTHRSALLTPPCDVTVLRSSSRFGLPASFLRRSASVLAALGIAGSACAQNWTVVASGLNNPRGLDFAPNGALYIAEAGLGGDGPTVIGAEGPVSYGESGSVTRVFKGKQERVATGLPSLAASDGSGAIGPSAISFDGTGRGWLTIGLGQDPAVRNAVFGADSGLGWLYQLNPNGHLRAIADLAAHELKNDPDHAGPDSNPNGVLSDYGKGAFVSDAGGNTLLHVDAKGRVQTIAVFPTRTVPTPPALPQPPFGPTIDMQAVPTNVVQGPDGALYVSQLTGLPFPPGGANVYRVVPGAAPTVYASGFTNIIDLEFDAAGNLYVLEIDTNGLLDPAVGGRLARVNAGTQTVDTIASTGLVMPGGLAIGPDGALYVTNFSVVPGMGQVIRIQP